MEHADLDTVSPWVQRFAGLAGPGEALDLACGGGRHARHLAALGHPVIALDRDPQALARAAGAGITTMQWDLEGPLAPADWPFAARRFALTVVVNYLHRPLLARLVGSMMDDGVLIYETFARGNEQFGKPSNPAFLLAPGELLDVATRLGLRVIAYEDGVQSTPRAAMVQRLCAVKPGFDRSLARLDAF